MLGSAAWEWAAQAAATVGNTSSLCWSLQRDEGVDKSSITGRFWSLKEDVADSVWVLWSGSGSLRHLSDGAGVMEEQVKDASCCRRQVVTG